MNKNNIIPRNMLGRQMSHLTKLVLMGVMGISPMVSLSAETTDASAELLSVTQQNNRKIQGVVKDTAGEPVIGANVLVKGTTNGVITDLDGRFSLSVPENAVLIVSYIGFSNTEIPVGSRREFNIALKEDAKTLDEVVVVGYGTQKKVNLSGAVSSVNVSDMTESRPMTNISSALSGLAAGVYINSGNNKPSNNGNASITVRGQGTLNNSSPLVIIDGVEGSMNSVSPQDVENISILTRTSRNQTGAPYSVDLTLLHFLYPKSLTISYICMWSLLT